MTLILTHSFDYVFRFGRILPYSMAKMLLSTEEGLVFAAILSFIFIFGFLGNILVCLAIYFDKDLRQHQSNFFLFNLAVTDLLTGTFVIPFCIAALIHGDWMFGDIWCQTTAFVYYSLAIVGVETLAFISWDRYYAIFRPLKYRSNVTPKRVCTAIMLCWVWAMVFTIPCAVLGWFRYGEYESMCTYNFSGTGDKWKTRVITYSIFTIVLCVLLPSTVIIYCYLRIIAVVRQQGRRINTMSSREAYSSNSAGRHAWRNYRLKGFRTITLVIILYILSWTPFSVARLLKTVTWNHEIVPPAADTFASVMSLFSTATNPIAYSLFRRDFRRAFKRLFRRALCKKQEN